MKTMYKASKWIEIEKVNIVEETASFVTLENGRRDGKRTDHHAYFDTWEEAKQWVVEIYKFKVEEYKKYLAHLEEELTKAQNLKP